MVGRFRVRKVVVVAVAVGALMAASCGDLPPPDLGSPTTTGVGVLDRLARVDAEPGEGTPPMVAAGGVAPTMIIATGAGIEVGPPSGLMPFTVPLDGLTPVLAVDDHLGGLVVQSDAGEVWWFPGEGGSSRLINGEGGSLLDVGLRDDTPAAALVVDLPDENATAVTVAADENAEVIQRVDLVELVTGTRSVQLTLDPGLTVEDYATGGGVSVVLYVDEACGGLLLLDAAGEAMEGPVPTPACPLPRRAAFGGVALGPDGTTLVYTEVSYRPDGVEQATLLIGRDLSSGGELFRLEVGGPTDRLSSLAFDGRWAAMLRTSLDPERESGPIVFDLLDPAEPSIVGLPDAFSVAFARRPLSVG